VERRQLGRSDVEVTRVILGGGNFGGIGSAPELFGQGESDEEAFAIMDAAWLLGLRAFDTADAYGGGRSETAIGAWMRETGNRPVLTTKTFNPMQAGADRGLSRDRLLRQLESSLARLDVDRVDLYLAHEFDPDTPVRETIETFESLVDAGLIAAWGVSNFDAAQLGQTLTIGTPAVVQNSYSLLDRGDEREVIPLCVAHGITYTPFSPLAGGWLTGKYRRDEPLPPGSRMTQRPEPYEHLRSDAVFDGLAAFARAAEERRVDTAALAYAWLLAQPHVTAIVVGPRRPAHLEPADAALELQLTPAEAAELADFFP
jgi:aryl-alcohol dehydrogenase-like predicted oxidoreductase